ncbi:hypothetical protein FGRMN_1916 [Fusarium graminum]|nr:hypothetical protein FGRMN_1916 [Fusarium graminum]
MATSPVQVETKPSSLSEAPTRPMSVTPNDCAVHGLSQTPHLDRILQNRPKAELQDLADAVQNLNDGDRCAKCAVQAAVTIVTGFIQEIYTAKKEGKLSKEDKKALKAEVKGLAKGVKGEIKGQKKQFKGQL